MEKLRGLYIDTPLKANLDFLVGKILRKALYLNNEVRLYLADFNANIIGQYAIDQCIYYRGNFKKCKLSKFKDLRIIHIEQTINNITIFFECDYVISITTNGDIQFEYSLINEYIQTKFPKFFDTVSKIKDIDILDHYYHSSNILELCFCVKYNYLPIKCYIYLFADSYYVVDANKNLYLCDQLVEVEEVLSNINEYIIC